MIASTPLPDALRAALDGYTHAPVLDGEAGAEVFRLAATGRPPLYLKCGAGRVADDVTAEAARLVWLAGRLPVPEVRQFVRVPDRAFLLSTALPGRTAYDCLVAQPERLAEIVGAVARFLRTLHALPLADCPFHAGHAFRLADARRNVAAGLVPVPDDADAGWSPAPVLARAEAMLPLGFERVVTHGDFSLGNVLVEDGRVTGCIDVGRLGAADPYQDLAILWENLGEFGAGAQHTLFEAYGIAAPDERRIEFHLCLDELF
jgi:aminoglycoside 3'-phosphotransferase-1